MPGRKLTTTETARQARRATAGGHCASSADAAGTAPAWLGRAETAAAAALLLAAVALHFRFWLHAGALWRDEINSVNLVALPLAGIWRNLQYDSFPLLWFLLLKAWIAVFGDADFAIRGMGLAVGLATLAALWRTSRLMGNRVPLLGLAVFALAPTLFTVGDSIRAYGLGSLLLVLLAGSMWRLVQQRTIRWAIETGILALLSVQCLYQNNVMLCAVGTSAAAAALLRRDWKLLFTLVPIGILAAVSVLPYLPVMAQIGTWNVIFKGQYDLLWLGRRFVNALGPDAPWLACIWLAWAVFAIGLCVVRLRQRQSGQTSQAVFVLSAMAIALAGYALFLLHLGYPTQAWYYLPVMALLAVFMDAAPAILAFEQNRLRIGILIATLVVAMPGIAATWFASEVRETNVDLVAAKLESLASPNDFIVVNPHYLGVSFARYYHGTAAWSTIPDLGEHRRHAYDRLMAKMDEADPIAPQIEKVADALRSGHSVWLVGWLEFVERGKVPAQVPPASKSPYGWSEQIYGSVWSQQVAWAIQQNASSYGVIDVPAPGPVNPLERAVLSVFSRPSSTSRRP